MVPLLSRSDHDIMKKRVNPSPTSDDLLLIMPKIKHFCSYQERSIRGVENKLEEWMVQEKKIPVIINQLQKENFLNEERFAKVFAGSKFRNNKWGRVKIQYELIHRGVPELLIQEGLLEIDETDYRAVLKKIIVQKKSEIKVDKSTNIRQKIVNFAIGKGFETGLIFEILNELKI